MEKTAPFTRRLTLAYPSDNRRSLIRACGSFILQCLKAIGESYVQAAAYNPYWIGAGPLPIWSGRESRRP